jgi:hypothetical protein
LHTLAKNQIGYFSFLQLIQCGKQVFESVERNMRELVECEIDNDGTVRRPAAGSRSKRRSVTVNLRESPLGWLKARGLVGDRQFEAGEKLRGDFERAALRPRVTMQWDGVRVDRSRGCEVLDLHLGQVQSKRRFDAALAAIGSGLSDVAWRVICAGESVPTAERALGWPARAGRIILTLALDRLVDHYRLP